MNRQSPVWLISWLINTIEWACILCNHFIHSKYSYRLDWNLDLTLQKLFEWLRRLLGMIQWTKPRKIFCVKASNLTGNPVKLIHILEGLQQAEHLKTLNTCRLQSKEISDWQYKIRKILGLYRLPRKNILTVHSSYLIQGF